MPLGACSFDLARGLLLRDGAAVPLRPKAFALLSHLARNTGRVVGKSELIEAVWPGVFVTEDSLTQAVHEVRKALADDAQMIVRTIARRGYLLITPAPAAGPHADPQPTVAVLRCLGASAGQSFAVYLVQGVALGVLGSLLGAALRSRRSGEGFRAWRPRCSGARVRQTGRRRAKL